MSYQAVLENTEYESIGMTVRAYTLLWAGAVARTKNIAMRLPRYVTLGKVVGGIRMPSSIPKKT